MENPRTRSKGLVHEIAVSMVGTSTGWSHNHEKSRPDPLPAPMDIPSKLPCLLFVPLIGVSGPYGIWKSSGQLVDFVVANFLLGLKAVPRRPLSTCDVFLEMAQTSHNYTGPQPYKGSCPSSTVNQANIAATTQCRISYQAPKLKSRKEVRVKMISCAMTAQDQVPALANHLQLLNHGRLLRTVSLEQRLSIPRLLSKPLPLAC